MNRCPEHGAECIWYQHNADRVGLDLGVGDGYRSGVAFAAVHAPMADWDYPVSNGRGDYYALGFMTGVTQEWCVDHDTHDCLGTTRCRVKVAASL